MKIVHQRGLTMVDVIVWVSVFVVTIIALISSITYFYRTNRFAIDQANATVSAQRGIDRMVRVIREASYSANGAYPIISMGTSSLSFYSDIDNDGFAEQMRYFIQGGNLLQGVRYPIIGSENPYSGAESISTTSQYVRNDAATPLFQYYDASGSLITNYTDVDALRFVVTTLVTDVDPLRTPTLLTLRSSAALRNLQ